MAKLMGILPPQTSSKAGSSSPTSNAFLLHPASNPLPCRSARPSWMKREFTGLLMKGPRDSLTKGSSLLIPCAFGRPVIHLPISLSSSGIPLGLSRGLLYLTSREVLEKVNVPLFSEATLTVPVYCVLPTEAMTDECSPRSQLCPPPPTPLVWSLYRLQRAGSSLGRECLEGGETTQLQSMPSKH